VLYPHLLAAHNLIRWLILAAGIFAVFAAATGWNDNNPVSPMLRRTGSVFVMTMDLQFVIGLALYFWVSPLTQLAFQNMSLAMKDHELRFFSVEHLAYMFLAVLLAHVGSVVSRKAKTDRAKYRGATIAYSLSLLLILAGIPWWRPLLRWGS
jgi:hypothetical protein